MERLHWGMQGEACELQKCFAGQAGVLFVDLQTKELGFKGRASASGPGPELEDIPPMAAARLLQPALVMLFHIQWPEFKRDSS